MSDRGGRSGVVVDAGETRTFARGDIYMIKDKEVRFPQRLRPRKYERPVILVQNSDELNDPSFETVLIIPLTTKIDTETSMCLPMEAADGLDKPSLAKAGLIQPVLKKRLGERVSHITPQALEALEAQILYNVGIIPKADSIKDGSSGKDEVVSDG